MKAAHELNLGSEAIEGVTTDDLPEQFGTTPDPPQPGPYRFKLPDNLTRYKIWVLAESGADHFGFASSSLVAKLPFNIRPSLPMKPSKRLGHFEISFQVASPQTSSSKSLGSSRLNSSRISRSTPKNSTNSARDNSRS